MPAPRVGRNRTGSLCLLMAASVLIACDARGGDWRQFRGPLSRACSDETGLPGKLDPARNIAWKIELPGEGVSSPIVVDHRLFTTCSSGSEQRRLHVLCLDPADGRRIWERQIWATGRTMCHEKTSVAAPTPVTDGERVYALFSSNDLACFDLRGNLVWLRALMLDYPNASNSLGLASSPIVAGEVLIVQIETDTESFVAGLDVLTGLNRWKKPRPTAANWTSPVVWPDPSSKKPVVLLQSSRGVAALDPASGKTLWNYPDGAATIPSSVTNGRRIFVPSFGITALDPSRVRDGRPRIAWRSRRLSPAMSSPLVLGDRLFVLNQAGVLTCGSTAAGNRLWQLRLKGPFSATPVSAGGKLYVFSETGIAQVVDPSPPEGRVIGEMNLGERILSTPAISGGAIYVRSDRHLWKITEAGRGS